MSLTLMQKVSRFKRLCFACSPERLKMLETVLNSQANTDKQKRLYRFHQLAIVRELLYTKKGVRLYKFERHLFCLNVFYVMLRKYRITVKNQLQKSRVLETDISILTATLNTGTL